MNNYKKRSHLREDSAESTLDGDRQAPKDMGTLDTCVALLDLFRGSPAKTAQAGQLTTPINAVHEMAEKALSTESLDDAYRFLEGLIIVIPDILFEIDRDGRYLEVWTKNPELLAATRQELIGRTLDEVLPPDAAAEALSGIREAERNGSSHGKVIPIIQQDGATRWFEHSIAAKPGGDGRNTSFLVLSRDVTDLKRTETVLSEARNHLLSVLQTMPDSVWLKNMEGRYLLCNHGFERLVGKSEAEIVGHTDFDLFERELAEFFRHKDQAAAEAGCITVNEEWVVHGDSEASKLLETRKVPVRDEDGRISGILGIARDITELNASRQEIQRMAYYDGLTSLPNRACFNSLLQESISKRERRELLSGVMLVDMDHFKKINDTMGHPTGDELLCLAAKRLNECVEPLGTVARFGGDEFAIILPDMQKDELAELARALLDKFADAFLLDGREVFVSCSIGVATYPNDAETADDLIRYADSALYLAKQTGRGAFRFYSAELTAKAEERLKIETELRHALERQELALVFQPKIRLQDHTLAGSEALLRWHHPHLGSVPPDRFIRTAEETGLIFEIGRWVLQEACRAAVEFNAEGSFLHKIAVNISARQILHQDLVAEVADILAETNCRPEWIEIEITESVFLDDEQKTLEMLTSLRQMGISIAIDDFGTGYSALSYLARFPIDVLKIDRSFVNNTDARSRELIKAILSIAECLGQHVVAEGVETEDQAAFLKANRCHAAQGYLYSKPMPKDEVRGWQREMGAMITSCRVHETV
ncbi:putative bifunctional diguanylate cyclase/phosphodiesterase [Rhizobium rhizogenes]|uniref:putative bifunctional diguanylate cyclase/phosphodiesterase n=1 Tax=Rhizobium rhizogenes TaxID=359 RepID=UPI001F371F7F|nr:EAL domain-containing protein [Rhizobium rhizogenes]